MAPPPPPPTHTHTQLVKVLYDTLILNIRILLITGALYKSFLVGPSATTEDIITMALDKANMSADHDPHHYCIWDSDVDQTNRSSKYVSLTVLVMYNT